MTLGESLQEIQKYFFKNDAEEMNKFGLYLMKQLQSLECSDEMNSQNGWLICIDHHDSFLVNRNLKIFIYKKSKPVWNSFRHKFVPEKREQNLNNVLFLHQKNPPEES